MLNAQLLNAEYLLIVPGTEARTRTKPKVYSHVQTTTSTTARKKNSTKRIH